MAFNREIHHRKSNRLSGFDYTQNGMYFLTICAFNRACIFGDIVNGETHLNDIGEIVAEEWVKTSAMRHNVELGEWVVMPNHFHAIVMIENPPVGAHCMRPNDRNCTSRAHGSAPLRRDSCCIGSIIAGFKSAVTKQGNILRQTPGLPLWQRNYHEHIIRTENDLQRICEYIQNNPLRWQFDSLYSREV